MKKYISFTLIVLFLSSCNFQIDSKNKENEFDKKIVCGKLANDFKAYWIAKKLPQNVSFDTIFYSPVLNSCLIEYECFSSPDPEAGNYTCKGFIDLADNHQIGSLKYFDTFGYEDPGYLPEICNKDFIKSGGKKTNIVSLSAPGEEKVLQKIYAGEKQYQNCLEMLKGGGNYIDIQLEAWSDRQFIPQDINPPITYGGGPTW
ncbi:membrane lipoprotein lipid attachment site-containing protein [Candidatus Gracilibacteria bacterium]|nr:membrane lipoprotein lipid attachment site-containing protein [Candidatus Gracilibacteria bacterium]